MKPRRERRKAPATALASASRLRLARSKKNANSRTNKRPSKSPKPLIANGRHSRNARTNEIQRTRPERKSAQSRRGVRLRHAHADPGASHPPRPPGPRRARHRPDRDGQDGGVHPADAIVARARARASAHAADAYSRADPRTCRPGRGGLRQIRHQPQAECRLADRGRVVWRSGGQDRPRRRCGHRDARAPA